MYSQKGIELTQYLFKLFIFCNKNILGYTNIFF